MLFRSHPVAAGGRWRRKNPGAKTTGAAGNGKGCDGEAQRRLRKDTRALPFGMFDRLWLRRSG